MNINCIAVDDEPLALDLIEGYARRIPYLNFLGSFHNQFAALEPLKKEKIDLLYLDINMPDLSGFHFLKGLTNPPKIIFITAYDQYAVQGFEVNAVDYLLKPVSFGRFLSATDRAFELIKSTLQEKRDYVFVRAENNMMRILLHDIHFIEGYKDYLKVHTNDPLPILTKATFKMMEELLPANFIRIHKSYMISIDKIISFKHSQVTVKDKVLPIGDSYYDRFYEVVVKGKTT